MQWTTTLSNLWIAVIQKWRKVISGFLENRWSSSYQLTHAPLLNASDLPTIHASAIASINQPLESRHEVSTLLVGERSSSYAGSGYEFAENQLYVTGDDSRFINWRLLARTGKIYRKKFIEERRPELWVVMDKRVSMRFGTRKRLKVTQAAIHALFHLYQGQQQQLACAGVILSDSVRWHKPAKDPDGLQLLVEDIIAAAPPIPGQTENNCLDLVLRQLVTRAAAGSIIILLSDFHNLSTDVPGSLYELTKKHRVIAKHIIDPIELKLPGTGKYQVASSRGSRQYLLDCSDNNFRQQYQEKTKHWQENIENQLTQAGASYQVCMSDDNSLAGAGHE